MVHLVIKVRAQPGSDGDAGPKGDPGANMADFVVFVTLVNC